MLYSFCEKIRRVTKQYLKWDVCDVFRFEIFIYKFYYSNHNIHVRFIIKI